ncbi:hypothetical protein [Mesorhizobium ventifaucium]|uniref:Uncharacterized protein n=1 Tax=Mesorhizobium ventifaucium TaxID=666020 RepID=A0ABN8JTN2_9HYPH|nr:hypothetical protein [Mesorhizobium ventifaucium]CAH2401024.1 hypothetical protein MES4922_280045 [Mesorhizobium ventifaucium]
MEEVAVPPIAPETPDLFLDRLLHPARHFERPQDVLTDMTLDVQEKRAILSSWASDACAVESVPALRMPAGATAPVTFNAIMDALRHLDELSRHTGSGREADGSTLTGFAAPVGQL